MAINYFIEDVENIKIQKRIISGWIKKCIDYYRKKTGNINFIFCSDEFLKDINIQYLKHDYYTDIITFNYNEGLVLSGDIYISTDRVYENSVQFKVSFLNELLRVIIHGVLHLVGFNDNSQKDKNEMRKIEEFWLSKYQENQ
jgi:probable rRNA maturation factor